MKKITLTLSFALLTALSYAQTITGAWYGTLVIPGKAIHLVFHIAQNGGIYSSTMDSPDQGATGLPADKTTFEGNQLIIDAAKYGIKYSGTYRPDSNRFDGIFTQGVVQIKLNLTATKATNVVLAVQPRPQDPKDFPYKQENIKFTNPRGGNQLAGTLTMPANGKTTKIIVLITGSGPQNRNEEITQFNHRPFLVWSDWLTRKGFAVLRYDDRGVAQSTGDFRAATSADFADDAEAAVSYIQSRADLNKLNIGLMGHSEGGIIAPMVASRNKAVKFIIMLAGPGVPVSELMIKQTADQARLSGAPADVIKLGTATNQKMYAAFKQYNNLPADAFKAKLDTLLINEFKSYPPGVLGNDKINDLVKSTVAEIGGTWYRYFININPATYLSKVTCPVLALNGTLDMQVNAEANLAAIKAILQQYGNTNHQEIALPGLNHLFQRAVTGSIAEYAQNTETVNPIALQKVADWLGQLK
jgi:alpha/beta superfamily hydrolase